MDRIKEAVKRARNAQTNSSERQPAEPHSAAVRFFREPAADVGAFAEAHCNFDLFNQNRIISNEQDPMLRVYRVMRTRVLQRMEAEGWRTLAVVSPNSGAGKTVTAINLAIAIGSKQGSRAMLVDLDFYRPSIARYLGLHEPPSVLDFFEGRKTLREVTVRPDLPDVLLLANERLSRRGAEYLTSPRADELLDRGLNEFNARVIIFDISPLLGCDDAIAFLPKVDCVLMVAASGNTRVSEMQEARRLLSKTHVLGSVLNKAPAAFSQRSYYY